jgi:transcriptional regulator with XRE-family HTH domain
MTDLCSAFQAARLQATHLLKVFADMSALENFAENLRRLCLAKAGSISAAARGMELGRSQIESYLQARRTPSRGSVKKICQYLGVTEEEMYQKPVAVGLDHGRPSAQRVLSAARDALEPLLFADPSAGIAAGLYHAYMTIPGALESLLCAVIVIAKHGSATTFRRLTNRAVKRGEYWSRFTGDHKGIVVERLNCLSFAAANQIGTQEPTLMRMRWLPFSEKLLGGHAMIFTPAGPSFSAVVMVPLPAKINLRTALRMAQVYQVADPAVPGIVRDMIVRERKDFAAAVMRDLG